MDVEHAQLLRLGEIAPLPLQLRQLRVEPLRGVAAPREIEPHLQIQKLLRRKIAQPAPHIVAVESQPALVQQLPVAREGLHQIVPVDFEKVLQDRELLMLLQLRRRTPRPVQPEVADFPVDQLLELQHQHRREIEIHPHAGEILDHRNHVEIALHPMQPHPRHHRRLRRGIDVVRLVHVPKKNDIRHERRAKRKRPARGKRIPPRPLASRPIGAVQPLPRAL